MSTFQLSPGVNVSEYDLTAIIPAVATSPGAIAGIFNWGPVGERVLVDSEEALVARFGKPNNGNYETWFTAASFLAYTNALWVVRGADTVNASATYAVRNALANTGAVADEVAAVTKNDLDYLAKLGTYDSDLQYIAKYPGAAGNSLRIAVVDTANAYSSVINCTSSVANGGLVVNAGSNTGQVVILPKGVGTVDDANTMATGVIADLSVGDLVSVGNSTIGYQYLKVTDVDTVSVTNATAAYFSVSFEDPYRLAVNWGETTDINRYWEFHNVVGTAPGQSWYVENFGAGNPSNDELHIVVVDEDGYFSGAPGSVLEVYKHLSRANNATYIDGTPAYYGTVLNNSKYVRWTNDRSGAASASPTTVANSSNDKPLNLNFVNGSDGSDEDTLPLGFITAAYDLFKNPEDVDVGLVMTGKSRGGVIGEQLGNYIIDNISETRKDCVGFMSPNLSAVVDNYGDELTDLVAFRNQCRSSSYGFLDSGYKQIYDRFSNVYRWVPLNGDMAGLCARTDETNDPWWAPAGYSRGRLKNVVRLAFNPGKAARDVMFPANINPVVTFHLDGTVLYGDKTLQARASAFDAINVRRLFIVLEKAIAKASKYFLWEFNDEYTRAQFRAMVNPYLRTVQGRRGITSFLVKCDGTNNTPDIIDRNMMVGDIYIKPNRAIRNIQLNFVATPTGVSFTEVELPQ